MVILLILVCALFSAHIVYVNITLRKDIEKLQSHLFYKSDEILEMLDKIYENQERKTLSKLIEQKQKQFIRRPQ